MIDISPKKTNKLTALFLCLFFVASLIVGINELNSFATVVVTPPTSNRENQTTKQIAKQATSSSWVKDPFENISFEEIGRRKKFLKNIPENINCFDLEFCPVCDVVEEWPLDFNGDDLAELAQRRICSQNTNYKTRPEVLIIYSSDRQPLIYKTNLNKCDLEVVYTHFQRHNFGKDNLDELLIVERNHKNKDETVSVLGFDFSQNKIVGLPIIDYLPDLEEKLIKDENSEEVREKFLKLNGPYGFNIKATTNLNRSFSIHYFQDSADYKFYPLQIQ